jgi:hypothetical protein
MALLQAAVDVAHRGGFVAAEIRAISNLSGLYDHAREARDSYRTAEELALRVGNRSLAKWSAEAARYQQFTLAEGWDAALAEGSDDRVDEAGSALDEIRRLAISSLYLLGRGESTDAILARIETLSTQTSDSHGPASLHALRSDRALLAGDYGRACDEAVLASRAEQLSWFYTSAAVSAALHAVDLERARQLTERLEADPRTDNVLVTERIRARAGIAALEGRTDEAIARYGDAMARHRVTGYDWDLARTALDLVALVGGDRPAVREAAAEARAIFGRAGARPYLAWLETAVARPQSDAAPIRPRERGSIAVDARGDATRPASAG